MFESVAPLQVRVETERLVLRAACDADLEALVAVMPDDLQLNPSLPAHPRLAPETARRAALLQDHWRSRGTWSAAEWRLDLVVEFDGAVVGIAGLDAADFPNRRVLETSSWLATSVRGLGIGTEMRGASLTLGFDHFGALEARSDALSDNAASLAVSRAWGYEENGEDVLVVDGVARRLLRRRLTLERWLSRERPDVRVTCPDDLADWLEVATNVDGPGASPRA